MEPMQRKTVTGTISRPRIYLLVAQNYRIASIHFSDSLPQVPNQFIERFKLSMGREVAIEIADQANTDSDIIQIIAVDVAARHLLHPSIANFDLTIPGRSTVADDKMVGQPIWHFAHVAVVIVKDSSVSLPCSAIMNDDIFPPVAGHPRIVDCLADRRGQVMPPSAVLTDRCHLGLVAGFLNHDFIVVSLAKEKPSMPFFWLWCGSRDYGWRLFLGRRFRNLRLWS